MTQQDAVRHWAEGADRMLTGAQNSLKSGDYEVALFSCHLAVEKMLKAKYISTHHKDPPITHNLVELCVSTKMSLTPEERDHLIELTSFSTFSRYGDESWLATEATLENCAHWVEQASAFIQHFRP